MNHDRKTIGAKPASKPASGPVMWDGETYLWNGDRIALSTLALMHRKSYRDVADRLERDRVTLPQALAKAAPAFAQAQRKVRAPRDRRRVSSWPVFVDSEEVMPPRPTKPIRQHIQMDGEVTQPGEMPRRFGWQGKRLTFVELAAVAPIDVSPEALHGRLKGGWTLERAMTEPVRPKRGLSGW